MRAEMVGRWVSIFSVLAITIAAAQAPGKASTLARAKTRQSGRTAAAGCGGCGAALAAKGGRKGVKSAPCHPKGYVDPKIARNFAAAQRELRREGISPEITSTWRSSEEQARLRRCSLSLRCRHSNPGLYYALPPGRSMHEAGLAVDISGVAAGPRGHKHLTLRGKTIVAVMRRHGFVWRYGLADPAHFEASTRQAGYRTLTQAINHSQAQCQIKLAARASGRSRLVASDRPGHRQVQRQARAQVREVAVLNRTNASRRRSSDPDSARTHKHTVRAGV